MSDITHVLRLESAIGRRHQCRAVYVQSVPIYDTHDGQRQWYGMVSIFNLSGHPTANRAYAWCPPGVSSPDSCRVELEIPPITSPELAVRNLLAQFDPAFAARVLIPQRLPSAMPDQPGLPR